MTRDELIKVLSYGIVIDDEYNLNEALRQSSDKLNILFKTKLDKKIAYHFIDVCDCAEKYKYLLDCLIKVKDEKVQRRFSRLVSMLREVPFNYYWKAAISGAVSISTENMLDDYSTDVSNKKVFSLKQEDQLLFIKMSKERTNLTLMYDLFAISHCKYESDKRKINNLFSDSLNLKLQDFSRIISLLAKNIKYDLRLPIVDSIRDILNNYSTMTFEQLNQELSRLEEELDITYNTATLSLKQIINDCPKRLLDVLEGLDSNLELDLNTRVKVKTLNKNS